MSFNNVLIIYSHTIIIARLCIQSDPVVQFYDPVAVCTACGETGHTTASCHYSKAEDRSNISHADMVFWSFVDARDRPDSMIEEESMKRLMITSCFSRLW